MSTHGVHAGSIEDMWQVAIEVARRVGGDPGRLGLLGPDTPPPAQRPLTLAIMEGEGWGALDEVSRNAFEQVVEQLRSRGITVLRRGEHPWFESFEQALDGMQVLTSAITGWENHWNLRSLIAQHPEGVSARTQAVVAGAERMTPADYRTLIIRREAIRERHAALAPVIDALIAPASPGPAPEWRGDVSGQPLAKRPTGDAVFNVPSSALGAPAVTVPLTAVGGLPMGVQLVGQPHTDARVTAMARWLLETLPPVLA